MATVKVYRAWRYEPSTTGEQHVSTCMYTREAIAEAKVLHIMKATEATIDTAELLAGAGRTPENFIPGKQSR